jgi:hypothetical protein
MVIEIRHSGNDLKCQKINFDTFFELGTQLSLSTNDNHITKYGTNKYTCTYYAVHNCTHYSLLILLPEIKKKKNAYI